MTGTPEEPTGFHTFEEFRAGQFEVARRISGARRGDWNGEYDYTPYLGPDGRALGSTLSDGTILIDQMYVEDPVRYAYEEPGIDRPIEQREMIRDALKTWFHEDNHLVAREGSRPRAEAAATNRDPGVREFEEGVTEAYSYLRLNQFIRQTGFDKIVPGIEEVEGASTYPNVAPAALAVADGIGQRAGLSQEEVLAELNRVDHEEKWAVAADLMYESSHLPAMVTDEHERAAVKAQLRDSMRNEFIGLRDLRISRAQGITEQAVRDRSRTAGEAAIAAANREIDRREQNFRENGTVLDHDEELTSSEEQHSQQDRSRETPDQSAQQDYRHEDLSAPAVVDPREVDSDRVRAEDPALDSFQWAPPNAENRVDVPAGERDGADRLTASRDGVDRPTVQQDGVERARDGRDAAEAGELRDSRDVTDRVDSEVVAADRREVADRVADSRDVADGVADGRDGAERGAGPLDRDGVDGRFSGDLSADPADRVGESRDAGSFDPADRDAVEGRFAGHLDADAADRDAVEGRLAGDLSAADVDRDGSEGRVSGDLRADEADRDGAEGRFSGDLNADPVERDGVEGRFSGDLSADAADVDRDGVEGRLSGDLDADRREQGDRVVDPRDPDSRVVREDQERQGADSGVDPRLEAGRDEGREGDRDPRAGERVEEQRHDDRDPANRQGQRNARDERDQRGPHNRQENQRGPQNRRDDERGPQNKEGGRGPQNKRDGRGKGSQGQAVRAAAGKVKRAARTAESLIDAADPTTEGSYPPRRNRQRGSATGRHSIEGLRHLAHAGQKTPRAAATRPESTPQAQPHGKNVRTPHQHNTKLRNQHQSRDQGDSGKSFEA